MWAGSPGKSPVCPFRGPSEAMMRSIPTRSSFREMRRRALREGAHVGLEPLARHAPERVGVDLRDLRAELADVVRGGGGSGGTGLRRGDDRDHGE